MAILNELDARLKQSKITAAFPIVGIGASAGGLKAFEAFFHDAPTDSGMAFVLVQHLNPYCANLLVEILQHFTTMPVTEALDQLPVKPNCVYIIPPNRDMTLLNGRLQLTIPNHPPAQRWPIDTFFHSLAADSKKRLLASSFLARAQTVRWGCRLSLNQVALRWCKIQPPLSIIICL